MRPDRLADLAHRRRVAAFADLALDELENLTTLARELRFGHVPRLSRTACGRVLASKLHPCHTRMQTSVRGTPVRPVVDTEQTFVRRWRPGRRTYVRGRPAGAVGGGGHGGGGRFAREAGSVSSHVPGGRRFGSSSRRRRPGAHDVSPAAGSRCRGRRLAPWRRGWPSRSWRSPGSGSGRSAPGDGERPGGAVRFTPSSTSPAPATPCGRSPRGSTRRATRYRSSRPSPPSSKGCRCAPARSSPCPRPDGRWADATGPAPRERYSPAVRCPRCSACEDHVVDSREVDRGESIRRRRECRNCGYRFTTFERLGGAVTFVVKRSAEREPFRREKIVAGVRAACKNRPVEDDADRGARRRRRERARPSGRDVSTVQIGVAVLDRLRELDEVAYIRFASVYKGFESLGDFEREAGLLTKATAPKQHRPTEGVPVARAPPGRRAERPCPSSCSVTHHAGPSPSTPIPTTPTSRAGGRWRAGRTPGRSSISSCAPPGTRDTGCRDAGRVARRDACRRDRGGGAVLGLSGVHRLGHVPTGSSRTTPICVVSSSCCSASCDRRCWSARTRSPCSSASTTTTTATTGSSATPPSTPRTGGGVAPVLPGRRVPARCRVRPVVGLARTECLRRGDGDRHPQGRRRLLSRQPARRRG